MLPMAVAQCSSGRVTKYQREWQLWGLSGLFKSIGNRRCKRDHSIGNNVMPQNGSDHSVRHPSVNRNLQNSERRRCGLPAGKGMMAVHRAGEV